MSQHRVGCTCCKKPCYYLSLCQCCGQVGPIRYRIVSRESSVQSVRFCFNGDSFYEHGNFIRFAMSDTSIGSITEGFGTSYFDYYINNPKDEFGEDIPLEDESLRDSNLSRLTQNIIRYAALLKSQGGLSPPFANSTFLQTEECLTIENDNYYFEFFKTLVAVLITDDGSEFPETTWIRKTRDTGVSALDAAINLNQGFIYLAFNPAPVFIPSESEYQEDTVVFPSSSNTWQCFHVTKGPLEEDGERCPPLGQEIEWVAFNGGYRSDRPPTDLYVGPFYSVANAFGETGRLDRPATVKIGADFPGFPDPTECEDEECEDPEINEKSECATKACGICYSLNTTVAVSYGTIDHTLSLFDGCTPETDRTITQSIPFDEESNYYTPGTYYGISFDLCTGVVTVGATKITHEEQFVGQGYETYDADGNLIDSFQSGPEIIPIPSYSLVITDEKNWLADEITGECYLEEESEDEDDDGDPVAICGGDGGDCISYKGICYNSGATISVINPGTDISINRDLFDDDDKYATWTEAGTSGDTDWTLQNKGPDGFKLTLDHGSYQIYLNYNEGGIYKPEMTAWNGILPEDEYTSGWFFNIPNLEINKNGICELSVPE
jgi:hypothetical protein